MDLTQFMHGAPGEIHGCAMCGALRREEDRPADYKSERYDWALMKLLYPRYRRAFERKRKRLEPLLPAHAHILEVGSHLGAFLETAENWGWKPIGLDIGEETSAFSRHEGGTVRRVDLEDFHGRPGAMDAVVIWNCFEQLEDPRRTLVRARELLTRDGLTILRVPNADYYLRHTTATLHDLRILAYNNLLGFPYLNGYTAGTLRALLRSSGYQPVAAFGTSILTPPYPAMRGRVRREWNRVQTDSEGLAPEESPWIEVVGRATAV